MNKRKWRNSGIVVLCLILLSLFGFGIYVSDYYHADETVNEMLESGLKQEVVIDEGKWLAILAGGNTDEDANTSAEKSGSGTDDVGFIFYPGAKVEYRSYLPLMEQISETGVYGYLAEMPFNLAFFGANLAEEIMEAHPEIEHWYIGGHSLGGAFASSFAAGHKDEMEGVVLLGAYLYGDYPVEQTMTIYGSEDLVLNREKITYTENVFELPGGNHAQFGNYGAQEGDGAAEISAEQQQKMTVDLFADWRKQ